MSPPFPLVSALVGLATIHFALWILKSVWIPLANNVRTARKSGLDFVIVPYYAYNLKTSIFFSYTLLKLADRLLYPASITSWRYLVKSNWPWKLRHAPFTKLETDTFLTVAPGGNILHTADPDVIVQITARGNDFPKATDLYHHIDIYGKNVVSSEGATWRHHRKFTSPSFMEKNNQLVWEETIDQSTAMLESWVGADGGDQTITWVATDTMHLSFNVISRVALGRKMEWSKMAGADGLAAKDLPPGSHTMGFEYSLHRLLSHLAYIMLLPTWVLKNSPFKVLQDSYEAFDEWGKHMTELVARKKATIQAGAGEASTSDLIGQLIKGQEEVRHTKLQERASLSESEVRGNIFVMMLAGHETSANSIHFSLMLLALHPEVQRAVQKDITEILKGRSMSEWNYDRDLPRLMSGMLGAVLNEELRLIAPTITVPKVVCSVPQKLTVNGKEVIVPANTLTRLCVPSVHRNPKFWPHGPPKDPNNPCFPLDNQDNDLEEFKPERWMQRESDNGDKNDLGATTDSGSSPSLYAPIKGSYIPFSDGQRACPGRRFAQVEVLAALAVILSEHSVELAVDEWATDEEVVKMTKVEKEDIWKKAEAKAHWTWQNKMVCGITLKLKNAHVPMRFVQKGKERFRDS